MELRNGLKDISGHKYDTIKDFNKLRIALRQLEKDYKNPTKHIIAKSVIGFNLNLKREIKQMVQQLSKISKYLETITY